MEIIIQGKKVETKDIYNIIDVEANKKMFLNREAGFIIQMIDKPHLVFKEDIPYESYPREIAAKKDKWEKLQRAVYDQWQKDKSDLPTFKL